MDEVIEEMDMLVSRLERLYESGVTTEVIKEFIEYSKFKIELLRRESARREADWQVFLSEMNIKL